jgi:hypothetical protein
MSLGLYIYLVGVLASLAYSFYLVRDSDNRIYLSDALFCVGFSLLSWVMFIAMKVGQLLSLNDSTSDNSVDNDS